MEEDVKRVGGEHRDNYLLPSTSKWTSGTLSQDLESSSEVLSESIEIMVAITPVGHAWDPERPKGRLSGVDGRSSVRHTTTGTWFVFPSRARTHCGGTIGTILSQRGSVYAGIIRSAAFQSIAIHREGAANCKICLCPG